MTINPPVAFFLSLILGFFLYGSPKNPDVPQSWLHISGAHFLFWAFLFSLYSWGIIFWRKLLTFAPDFLGEILVGTASLVFVAELFGLLGLIGFFPSLPLLLVLCLGPLLYSLWFRERAKLVLPSFKGWPVYLLCTITLFLLYCLTWIPDSMPDPLWYHLTSARWWMEEGKIFLPEKNSVLFKSGSWEALFFWGQHLLGGPNGGGLITNQLFGQWLHLLLAGIGSFLALARIFRFIFPSILPPTNYFLALLSCLSLSQMETLYLAKNDWGAIFFSLGAFALLLEHQSKGMLVAGLLFGFAFTTKFTAAFTGIFLVLFAVINFKLYRHAHKLLLGFLLASSLHLLRNAVHTGNPFFPALQHIFPSPFLGPSWLNIRAFEGQGLSFVGKAAIFLQLLLESPFVAFALVIPPFFFFQKFRNRWNPFFWSLLLLMLALFLLKVGPKTEPRLLGAGGPLLTGMGVGSLLLLIQVFFPKAATHGALLLLLFLVPTTLEKFPWQAPLTLIQQASPPEEIRTHFAGTSEAWLRLNASERDQVATAGEYRIYYLSPLRAYRIWDNPSLDRSLHKANNAREIIDVLASEGIRYLLVSRVIWDVYHQQETWDAISKASLKYPESIAFQNENARIIDIPKLQTLATAKPH